MSHSSKATVDLALAFAGFGLLVTSVLLLWRDNALLLIITCLECALALLRWHDGVDISSILVIGVLGSLAEVLFVRSGVWRYTNPSVFGLPMWFPFAFGTTGLMGQRLSRSISSVLASRTSADTVR